MRSSTRISLNVVASLFRLAASIAFGLLSSRWLFAYLGDESFGTLTALGASGTFVFFFSISLVRGLQREVAFHTGRGDVAKARSVFGSSMGLFVAIAIAMFAAMYLLKPYILGNMHLPQGRLVVIEQVYLITIAQISVIVATSPYRAALEACQHLAVISIFETVLSAGNFLAMLSLSYFSGEPLIVASSVQALFAMLNCGFAIIFSFVYCRSVVSAWGVPRIKNLAGVFSITGWSMFGHLNWIVRNEASVFALNVFYGPIVNASYSLALRLHAFQNELAFNVVRALQPALTAAVAGGDRERERALTLLSSKLPVLASLFVWIPILFCAEEVMQVWLGRIPEHAPWFLRVLGLGMMGMVSYGHQMGLESHGKLAGVTLWMTIPPILAFAIWCALQPTFHFPLTSLPMTQLLLGLALVLLVRPLLHGKMLGIAPAVWFREVVVPVAVVHGVGALCALPPLLSISDHLLRLVAVTVCADLGMVLAVWASALNRAERNRLREMIATARARISSR